jgi:cell wall-associated NlpC family hydrolase
MMMSRSRTSFRFRAKARLAARISVAALLAVSLSAMFASPSLARPTRQQLAEAQAKLDSLNRNLSLLVEQYDQTSIKLHAAQQQLQDARTKASAAAAAAGQARAELSARATAAYEGAGSELDILLGSTSLSQFSERLEFLNAMARQDVTAATTAQVSRQAALWAAQQLQVAVQQRSTLLAELDGKKRQIVNAIAQEQGLIRELRVSLARQAAAAARARAQAPPPPPPNPGGGGPPPPPTPGAGAALAAAYSVIGAPYKWGGSDPKTGFDCSGLTMWSWAHAGVSLPHSAALQYDVTRHISRFQLRPGDLLFFYSPISHVGMYVGGDQMIDSSHPGLGVSVHAIYWQYFVGAGRPG